VKIRHFVELSRKADVIVAVDNPRVVEEIAAAGRSQEVAPQVVVDVDVGQARCGVEPGEPALALARRAIEAGLRFRGLMGYEGHAGHLPPGPEKERAAHVAMDRLVKTRCLLEGQGIAVEIVSAGGTGTYSLSGRVPGVTEIQGGSYLMMDTDYRTTCTDFDMALSVLGTVISKTGEERFIVDVGLKAISAERGLPVLKCGEGARLRKLNAEHGIVDILDPRLPVEVGDQVEIWPCYSDATINLHERMYGLRNGAVEEVLRIEG
jgi:D-serine deaminase-like pyridoxal phosphate-dependent protein